jgi:hypothetical protein
MRVPCFVVRYGTSHEIMILIEKVARRRRVRATFS